MKRKLTAFSLMVFSLVLSKSAFSQSSDHVYVPFAFEAGSKQLPAGDYLIQQKAESHFVTISDLKTGKAVYLLAGDRVALPMDAPAKLVFHQYGGQHFLAAIWEGRGGTAMTFSASDMEKQLRGHQAGATEEERIALK
jgi:hypothetical protein